MSAQEVGLKILEVVVGFFRILFWYVEALFRRFVPPSMKSIDGETILVTGAAGGIGKEICRHLVQSGTNIKLVIWDLRLTDLEKLAEDLKSRGAPGLKVFPFVVDISSRENIEAGCQQVKDTVGSVTVIFNNAGICHPGNFLQNTNEQIVETFQVNLLSHLWIIRQFLPEMVVKNHGRIVNICSIAGLKAATFALPYFASKFAVNGYTEALKAELNGHYQYDGIHFSTVYPYFVQTPLVRSLVINTSKSIILPGVFKRFQKPEEVARRAVDGMRRELEYIYCPPLLPVVILLDYLMPKKVQYALESKLVSSFVFKDAEEQKRILDAPFLPPNAAGIKAKKGQ